MSQLATWLAEFDEADVKAMDAAIKKFADYKTQSKTALPDFSPSYVAYTPILSFALLKSQASMEKLTRWLIGLTVALFIFAVVQVWLLVR